MSSLIARSKAGRIEAYTGVDVGELNQRIATTYRQLLDAKRASTLKKKLTEIKLAVLMERRKSELLKDGPEPSQASCKTFALAQPEYLHAVIEEDTAKGDEILLDAQLDSLKADRERVYKEAKLAHDELYTLRQKQ